MNRLFIIVFSIIILTTSSLSALPRVDEIKVVSLTEQTAKSKSKSKGRWIAAGKVYKNRAGFFFLSSEFARPRGYRGANAVLVWLSADKKKIRTALLVASDDSPAYVRYILKNKHLHKYKGRSVSSILRSGNSNSISVVSGATCSCDGIYASIFQSLKKVILLLK